jgi:hypothetical protein
LIFTVLVASSTLARADAYPASIQVPANTGTPEVAPTPDTEASTPTLEVAPTPDTEAVTPTPDTEATTPTHDVAPTPDDDRSALKKAADDAGVPSAHDAAIGDSLMALVGGSLVFLLLAILAGLLLYMLPTLIARSRGHRNSAMIGFINFFTGWTLLGWIGCLVWAVSNPA